MNIASKLGLIQTSLFSAEVHECICKQLIILCIIIQVSQTSIIYVHLDEDCLTCGPYLDMPPWCRSPLGGPVLGM